MKEKSTRQKKEPFRIANELQYFIIKLIIFISYYTFFVLIILSYANAICNSEYCIGCRTLDISNKCTECLENYFLVKQLRLYIPLSVRP
jgi:hypothetical protein